MILANKPFLLFQSQEKQQNNTRYLLVLFYGLFLSLVFLALYLTSITAFFFIGLILLFSAIFLFSEKEQFLFIVLLIPNLYLFKYPERPDAILGYYIVLVGAVYLYKFYSFLKFKPFLLFHFLVCLITSTYWGDFKLIISVVKFTVGFYFFSTISELFTKKEICTCINYYIIGSTIAIVLGIIYHLHLGDLYNGSFAGINCERNYFSAVISPTLAFIILLFMRMKLQLKQSIVMLVASVFYFICLLLCASRIAVIALIFPCILLLSYIPLYNIKIDSLKKIIIIASITLFISIFLFGQYGDAIEHLVDRFGNESFKTGSGRFDLWKFYYERNAESIVTLLIGSGIPEYGKNLFMEHNLIVQCFSQTGILGLITYFGAYFHSLINYVKKINHFHIMNFTPIFMILFCFLGISAFHSNQFSGVFILSLSLAYYLDENIA